MNHTESLDQVYIFDLQRIQCSRVPRMLPGFSPAVVSKKRLSIFILRAQSRPPCAFSGVVLLRSQVRRALLGRCTKVPVSARGFRKQWQQRDLLPESAVSGRPLQGLSPLPDGPHAGCHSSRHGAGPLPWCCLALMTGGLWRHRSRTPPSPSSHLRATHPMLLFPVWAKNNLHAACHYLLLCWGGADCALHTLYWYQWGILGPV